MRSAARARPGTPRIAEARCAQRGAGTGDRRRGGAGVTDGTRARDRGSRCRPADEPADRREALPQQEDRRVAHPQPVREARCVVARRDRPAGRAGAPPRRRCRLMDADAVRLKELGYRQELQRRLRLGDTLGLGGAGISPLGGLCAVVLVGPLLAGPAWVWVLPVALAGQCLLLGVYTELAAEFPIAGGAYQWSRRLIGGAYGWFAGWVAIWAYAAANPTVAYLGAPWALALFGVKPTPHRVVFTAMILLVLCGLAGSFGVVLLGRIVKLGISAELVASVGVGLALLFLFHNHGFSLLTHSLGASPGSSTTAGLLAALAVGGWVFIGFDVIVGAAEETERPERQVPRAIWVAVLLVGTLVMLNAAA